MFNNLSFIKEKLSRNELVLGTTVSFSDPEVTEVLCNCGYDFIWIDGEHGSIGIKDIDLHIMATRGYSVAPFVRVPVNDPAVVKPILDMGPAGIIFPLIKNADEARLAVASCKYPPQGLRGFGPRRANNYCKIEMEEYLKDSEREPWVIIQIEHIDAVNNLEEILNVKGIDSIVIGPNDLSSSIGLLGQTRHPDVLNLFDKIALVCKKTNTIFGVSIGYGNTENIKDWISRGVNWLSIDWDVGHLFSSSKLAIETVKKIAKI